MSMRKTTDDEEDLSPDLESNAPKIIHGASSSASFPPRGNREIDKVELQPMRSPAGGMRNTVTPEDFSSLHADLLGIVVRVADPRGLWALALAEKRCLDVVNPRLQALATLRLPPFSMRVVHILRKYYLLNNKALGAAEAQTLAAIITDGHMAHVEYLNISRNILGVPGVQALAPVLSHLPRLEMLCFDANSIGEAGAVVLAKAAAYALPRLRELRLCTNRIGDGGLRAIAAAVAGGAAFASLVGLHLSSNDIGDLGVEALATACASPDVLPRLTILSMFDNNIDAAGMRALASAINGGGLPCMDFRGSMLCDNPGSFEPVRAALLKRVYTIHDWLESVQSG